MAHTPLRRHGPLRHRRAVIAIGLLAAAAAIFGARIATRPSGSTVVQHQNLRFVPVPLSPAIEQAWGIRFTAVILGADRGIVDLRYVVVNSAKSARIHGGSVNNPDPNVALKSMPIFIREPDGAKVLPSSAMMHFEHFHFQTEAIGTGWSLLYGNSGGILHVGDKVTLRMADGLEIHHIVIAN